MYIYIYVYLYLYCIYNIQWNYVAIVFFLIRFSRLLIDFVCVTFNIIVCTIAGPGLFTRFEQAKSAVVFMMFFFLVIAGFVRCR